VKVCWICRGKKAVYICGLPFPCPNCDPDAVELNRKREIATLRARLAALESKEQ